MRQPVTLFISVLISATLAAAGAEGKPGEPVRIPEEAVERNGHHYLLVDKVQDLSWTSARRRCKKLGGDLVVIENLAEARFIAELCDGRYMFLGASDAEKEGTWTWVDGTPWKFVYWLDDQPNNYGDREHYLATYDDGLWVDVEIEGTDFWTPTGYICEWNR